VEVHVLSSASRRLTPARVAWVAGAVALVGVSRVFPADGVGLALRLAVAACLVLLLPGAAVVSRLGRPASVGLALAAALAWSLVLVAAALALTVAFGASLTLTVALVAALALAALLLPSRTSVAERDGGDRLAACGVAAAGALFAMAVWRAAGPLQGDALFHAARARKLAEFDTLDSVRSITEFPDGGLHPGYAFPLWHAVLALLARVGGVDVADVVVHLAAVLVPLALVLAYAAGAALFGSWAGGAATAAAQAAVIDFSGESVTSFRLLSLPVAASLLLLVPAVLALAIGAFGERRRSDLLSLSAAALALAVVHPTYVLFTMVVLAGFAVARLALTRHGGEARTLGLVAAAVGVPAGAYLLWLLPSAAAASAHTPGARERAFELAYYSDRVDLVGNGFRLAPGLIAAGGVGVVAGLVAIPFATLAWRRRWAAFVLGGSLAVLAVALVPALFERLADLVSLSQALRVRYFLPLPFALAGAGLLAGRVLGRADARRGAVAVGLVLAVAVPTLVVRSVEGAERSAGEGLPAGLVHVLRGSGEPGEVVLSDPVTSYRIAGYAPVYILAAPLAHVAQTASNRPYERIAEVDRFFAASTSAAARRQLIARYGVDWILVDRARTESSGFPVSLKPVYDDGRYALFRVTPP
jgi:hypothetical protein